MACGPLAIDASTGEGGGQLLRTAVALSAITGRRVRLARIRAGRARPGLAAQHLAAVRAVAALCDARVTGLEPGSQDIDFDPRAVRAGDRVFEVGTAGSVTLVLQALLPVMLSAPAPSRVRVAGGAIVLRARATASVLGAGRVAQRGIPAECLGGEAGAELRGDLACGAALDTHAADQLLVYLALAGAGSRFTTRAISSHARTAMWLSDFALGYRDRLLGRIVVVPLRDGAVIWERPDGAR